MTCGSESEDFSTFFSNEEAKRDIWPERIVQFRRHN
jgi:hypothetical protein